MTYRPKHFTIDELVDPWFIANYPEVACWNLLDEKALRAIDALRDKFGPLLINGRGYTESGLRRPDTKTGAKFSMHKVGKAFDLKPLQKGVTVTMMFDWIMANQAEAYAMGIRRVEDIQYTTKGATHWLHVDAKDTGAENVGKIVVVKP